MRRWLLLVTISLMVAASSWGQQITITGTVKDTNGNIYQNGTGKVVLVPQNIGWTTNNGYPVNQVVWVITGLGGFAQFSVTLPSSASFDQQAQNPQYTFSFCSAAYPIQGNICFTTTPITLTSSQDITSFITPQAAILPITGGGGSVSVNTVPITNANFQNSANCTYTVVGSNITSNCTANFLGGVVPNPSTFNSLLTLPAGLNSSGPNTLNGVTTVGLLGNVAVKPNGTLSSSAINDSIQYVSPNGSDSNDGLSWGSSRLTILGAYNALPGKGGTIYITGDSNQSGSAISCVRATPVAGQGIGFAGVHDPNFGSMPQVINNVQWVAYTKFVSIIGIPSNIGGTSLNSPGVCILAGNGTTDAIMLSGSSIGIGLFNLIEGQAAKRGLVIGENSAGGRTFSGGIGAWSGLWIDNDTFSVATTSTTNGPAIDCTGGSFQLYFNNFSANTNQTATINTNAQAAMLMDGASPNGGCGLATIRDAHFNGGGLRYTGQPTATNFNVDGVLCEAQLNGDACVHLLTASGVTAHINNVDVADCAGTVAGVQVDITPGNPVGTLPDNVEATNINSACNKNIQGEMIGEGQWSQNLNALPISPVQEGQVGIIKGHVIGQEDAARSGFGPVSVRFPNIVLNQGSWTITAGGTLTTGIAAPDGTTGAVQGANAGGSGGVIFYPSTTTAMSIGDYFFAGAWVRSQTLNGYSGISVINLAIGNTAAATILLEHGAPWKGDGEWEWVWQLQQVTAVGATPTLQMNVGYDSTHTIQAYGPLLLHIPAGTISANEAFNLAYNLQSYSRICSPGQLCSTVGAFSAFVYPTAGIPLSTGSSWGTSFGAQGSDSNLLTSGTVSGSAGTPLCLDSSGGATTTSCVSGVFQVNGVPLSSTSTINFQNSAAFNGVTFTFSNPSAGNVQLGASGQFTNAALQNSSTTVNGQSCILGSTCTVPFQANGVNNTSQAGLNAINSTTNAVGLTVTFSNPGTNQVKAEITGGTYTGTAAALGATPTDCGGGQFATGIAANGNAICATPAGGGNVNAPANFIEGQNIVSSNATTNVLSSSAQYDFVPFSTTQWGTTVQTMLAALPTANSRSFVTLAGTLPGSLHNSDVNPWANLTGDAGIYAQLPCYALNLSGASSQWLINASDVVLSGCGTGGDSILTANGSFPTNTPMVFLGGSSTVFGLRLENFRLNCGTVTDCSNLFAENVQEGSGINHATFFGGNAVAATAPQVEFEDPAGGGHYIINDLQLLQSGANDFFYAHSQGASASWINRLTCNNTTAHAGLACFHEDSIDGNPTFNYLDHAHLETGTYTAQFSNHSGGSADHIDCTTACSDTLHLDSGAIMVTSEFVYGSSSTNTINDLSLTPNVVLTTANYPNGVGFYTNQTGYFAGQGGHTTTFAGNHTLNTTESWVVCTTTCTFTVPHALAGQRWFVFNSGTSLTLSMDTGTIAGNGFTPAGTLTVPANTGFTVEPDGTNATAVGGGGSVSGGTTNAVTFWTNPNTLGSILGTVTNQVLTAQNGVAPIFVSPGMPGTFNSSATSYSVQCDSGTTTLDRLKTLIFTAAAGVTVTVPDAGSSGCGSNFTFGIGAGPGAGTITVNRTSSSSFTILNGTSALSAQTTFTLTAGQFASFNSYDNANYLVRINQGGGGGGGGATLQTNSVNNSSQTTLNLLNSAAFNGLTATFTNTSAGNVQLGFAGTLGNAGLTNSSVTVNGQSCVLGATCSVQFLTNGVANTSLAGLNLTNSAATNGITLTVTNTGTNVDQLGYTGTLNNSGLTNPSTTVNAQTCTLGSTCTINPPLDKSTSGLANPTADATFTYPAASVSGLTLAGTAPASVSTSTGTNASTLFNVNGVTGGADSNATGTGGIGSQPTLAAGNGGAGTGTNTVGGAGGNFTITAGNGGASLGTGANSNGGSFVVNLGSAGTGGSGAAGTPGLFKLNGQGAGSYGYDQGADNCVAILAYIGTGACMEAPSSGMTNYRGFIPPVAANGVITNNVAAAVDTQGFSGDSNHSATVTIGSGTSIGSTSLCSTAICPAGTYDISVYVDITTACGTTGTYIVNLIYTDDQGSKTVPVNLQGTGSVPLTGTLTTTSTSNFGQQVQVIRSTGAASINYSTTATACGTAGPMVGKLYLSATPKQ